MNVVAKRAYKLAFYPPSDFISDEKSTYERKG